VILVEMPAPMTEMTHCLDPAAPDLCCENLPEPIPLEPNGLVGNVDPTLVQQVLDVPERERIADIQHHRQADDLGARLEVAKDTGVAHVVEATVTHPDGKPIFL
jgi:hypothetical protein